MSDTWNRFKAKFTEHPHSVNQTYTQHLWDASKQGFKCCLTGGVLLCHAVCPFLFEKKGSQMISEVHQHFIDKRKKPE